MLVMKMISKTQKEITLQIKIMFHYNILIIIQQL
jgi:hypothetical protein